MKSLLLSTLRSQYVAKGEDAFRAAFPHPWLLWEPGAWKPPQKRTMQLSAVTPTNQGGGDEALALALAGAATLVLGRDPACDLVINEGTLSARHLVLTQTASGWAVEDAGSSNGTHVDGRRLDPGEQVLLCDGARVQAGQAVLSYCTPEGLWRRLTAR